MAHFFLVGKLGLLKALTCTYMHVYALLLPVAMYQALKSLLHQAGPSALLCRDIVC